MLYKYSQTIGKLFFQLGQSKFPKTYFILIFVRQMALTIRIFLLQKFFFKQILILTKFKALDTWIDMQADVLLLCLLVYSPFEKSILTF